MAASILDVLPPDLIKSIIACLFSSWERPAIDAAMQTCSALRLICSECITHFEVNGVNDMGRFPMHAHVRTLTLGSSEEPYPRSTDDALNGHWLDHAAAFPHRLAGLEKVVHYLESIDDAPPVLSALARYCPFLRILVVECENEEKGILPEITFPMLEDLVIDWVQSD